MSTGGQGDPAVSLPTGKTRHPLYHTYNGMLARCYNPNAANYRLYGGRGITVCAAWRHDFWQFVADMGDRPAAHTLDRVDNDGPYSPENCRWAPRVEQNTNRRPYRDGKCRRGHDRDPDGKACKPCQREYNAAYYASKKGKPSQ